MAAEDEDEDEAEKSLNATEEGKKEETQFAGDRPPPPDFQDSFPIFWKGNVSLIEAKLEAHFQLYFFFFLAIACSRERRHYCENIVGDFQYLRLGLLRHSHHLPQDCASMTPRKKRTTPIKTDDRAVEEEQNDIAIPEKETSPIVESSSLSPSPDNFIVKSIRSYKISNEFSLPTSSPSNL
ncbi:hypothetical protein H5410_000717 [Solanum commersonii]|uniref:Uncharacterized protein n=1 Tax=Solanum commersonii TaxID=4109 RepID=A0A9J6AX05_SOLCO|nr:hypothetical protein H5410_000717 [Solanum commersonii]